MLTNTKIFCFPSQIQMASNTVFITLLSIQYGGLIVPCWVSEKLAATITISKGSWNHNFQTSRTCETNVLLKQERLNNTPINTPPPPKEHNHWTTMPCWLRIIIEHMVITDSHWKASLEIQIYKLEFNNQHFF